MKKEFGILLGILLVSCTAGVQPEADCSKAVTIRVGVPENLTVKSSLGEKSAGEYPVLWNEGDVILVNGVASNPLSASEAGAAYADFTLPSGIMPPYNIVYAGFEGEDDLVSIPFRQEISSSGSFGADAAPMWAVSADGGPCTLEHLAAVIHIPVNGSGTVAHIRVSAVGGESLAGEFLLSKTTGKLNGGTACIRSLSELYLVPPSGVALSGSDYVFVAALAPGCYSEGVDVQIVTTEGEVMHIGALQGETLAAGTVYEFPAVTFAADEKLSWVIASESDLAAWRSALDSSDELALYGRASLTADIDLTGDAWTTPFNIFNGTLDGGGHKISGLSCPLFNVLHGNISNLTLDSSIESIPANSCAGLFAQRMNTNGNYVPCIRNCFAEGSITIAANTSAGAANAGGIVGSMESGRIDGCSSSASISVAGVAGKEKILNAGGITGSMSSSSEVIQNCISLAGVSVSGVAATVNAGGIVGLADSPVAGCINLGSIRQEATASASSNKGAIAGKTSSSIGGSLFRGSVM